MTTDFRALCAELLRAWQFGDDIAGPMNRARAELAQPEPEAPEPGYEKGYAQEHLARLMRDAIGTETNHNVYIVAAGKILDRPEFAHVARWGTPTIKPVPVSERPWEREGWCDAEGQCWWFRPADFDEDDPAFAWYLDGSPAPETCWEIRFYGYTHSLPHHALPTPEATNA